MPGDVARFGRMQPARFLRPAKPRVLLVAVGAALLSACASPFPYADASKPHRSAQGFISWGQTETVPNAPWYEVIRRRWRGDFQPAREPAGGYAAFAERWRVRLTAAQLSPPPAGQARVAWLGHAGLLVQAGGQNILIDPQLGDFAGPVRWLASQRRVPPPITPEELLRIDTVLITHNHYDHLDEATLKRLHDAGQRPRVWVPLGLKSWFESRGWTGVEELDWWDQRTLGEVAITFVPAQHWSRRSVGDTNQTLWGGWQLTWQRSGGAAPWRFMHTGDTGYNEALFDELRRRIGAPVDFLAVPIGAYEPRDFMRRQHNNPAEAVRIAQQLQARDGVAVHWGTFELSHEPFDQPPTDLRAALTAAGLPEDRIRQMRQGEAVNLSPGERP